MFRGGAAILGVLTCSLVAGLGFRLSVLGALGAGE